MKHVILQGDKITRIFHQGKRETKVLDEVDINILEKDFTVHKLNGHQFHAKIRYQGKNLKKIETILGLAINR